MKQHNEPKKVQLFIFFFYIEYRLNLNFMYGCHGYQNKILGDIPVIIYCDDSIFLFHDFKDRV